MRVLLIQPPLTLYPWEMRSVDIPLGLAYIAGYLEKEGHVVDILDSIILNWRKPIKKEGLIHYGLYWPEILKLIKQKSPDVIGINCAYTSQAKNTHILARHIKKHQDIPVVLGGAHASSLPKEVLLDKNIDAIIIGEGETSFSKFLLKIENNDPFDDLDGIAYRKNNIIKVIPKTKYIEDIDSIPFPARHLLPITEYFSALKKGGDMTGFLRLPKLSMITSRGCPGKCIFCSIHSVWGPKWRPRSPENVLEELTYLVEKYRLREIHFLDDNISLSRKRMINICNLIKESKLDLKWTTPNGLAIWTLNKDLLRLMKDSGCYRLMFGIESGDPRTLRYIKKPINLTFAEKIIRQANEIGIWTHGFFIFGFPHENMSSILNTLNFSLEADLDFASFFIATPLPGSELYEICKEKTLEENWEYYRTQKAVINTSYFTKEELDKIQKELYSTFFKRRLMNSFKPRKFLLRLKRIRGFEDIFFILNIINRLFEIFEK